MKEEAITEKIRKLLRLAKSSNQAEAQSALSKAMELAARHQIDVSALSDDDEIAKLVTRYFRCGGKRLAREWKEAMAVARQFFIGTEMDIQIADYVTSFLVRTCRVEIAKFTEAEKRQRRRMSKNKRASFVHAYFGGIWVQLKGQREKQVHEISGLEIVLSTAEAARKQRLADEFGPTKTSAALARPRASLSTLYAGYDAGLNTKINPALGTDAPLALDYTP